MGITHVIRGDDHLNNTPRQIQLYRALGFTPPLFAHVPMILGADKKRLSKRHGATSVMAYRDMGFLPEALLNYLVRLGWSHQDQEIFPMADMIQKFNLESCSSSAAVFNNEKLLWLNGVYIREGDPARLAELTKFHLAQKGINDPDEAILVDAVKASQEKVKTLVEMAEMVDFFFTEVTLNDKDKEKFVNETTKPVLLKVKEKLALVENWTNEGIHQAFEDLGKETTLGLGKLAGPTRMVLTGKAISPGIYDIIRILGKNKVSARIEKWI
ncbi:MAG: glutamyl-tRNA synthetase [uncultured bacterium]|nr:MAG: glutamyl-tRNA synthetase [uncultured bacterium]